MQSDSANSGCYFSTSPAWEVLSMNPRMQPLIRWWNTGWICCQPRVLAMRTLGGEWSRFRNFKEKTGSEWHWHSYAKSKRANLPALRKPSGNLRTSQAVDSVRMSGITIVVLLFGSGSMVGLVVVVVAVDVDVVVVDAAVEAAEVTEVDVGGGGCWTPNVIGSSPERSDSWGDLPQPTIKHNYIAWIISK